MKEVEDLQDPDEKKASGSESKSSSKSESKSTEAEGPDAAHLKPTFVLMPFHSPNLQIVRAMMDSEGPVALHATSLGKKSADGTTADAGGGTAKKKTTGGGN